MTKFRDWRLRQKFMAITALAAGLRVRFTTLEHIGHNAWESAYRSPEVWSWLGEQRAARQR